MVRASAEPASGGRVVRWPDFGETGSGGRSDITNGDKGAAHYRIAARLVAVMDPTMIMCYAAHMTIWRQEMTTTAVSVTEFKAHCLDVIRRVEQDSATFDLTRHGKVVARLVPTPPAVQGTPAWLRLRGRGQLNGAPEESMLADEDFEALR